ncbi:hypothetical protein [Nocardioides sp.]|jgi:hypothetical protein|uniref:hypothetical protein n=1 Tax=Nocardioides sp. TaxID=35761 RepID=UPI00351921D7|nr:hypothetical protein [Nocardioides sp.]
MQRDRRRDPYPWTWEVPLAVTLATLFVIVIGIQLGRSVANLLAGAGWTWPDANAGAFPSPIGTAFWTSLPGVLGGNAEAGLPTPVPGDLAGRGLVWASLALTELSLLAATIWAGVWAYQRWGPGRMRGMATAAEAEKLLGVTRLRKVAGIVRPDIYGKHAAAAAAPMQRTPGDHTEQPGPHLGHGLSPWLLDGRRTKEER